MLSFLPLPSSEARRLAAAKAALSHVAEGLDARFSVRLWDGSVVPMGRDVAPGLCVSIAGPGVIGSLLRRPTLENLVRQYATGRIGIEGGDLMEVGAAVRVDRSSKRLKGLKKGLLLRSVLPFLFAPAEKAATRHAYAGEELGPRRGEAGRRRLRPVPLRPGERLLRAVPRPGDAVLLRLLHRPGRPPGTGAARQARHDLPQAAAEAGASGCSTWAAAGAGWCATPRGTTG